MLNYDEAVRVVLETVTEMPTIEVPLDEALGRVAAAPLRSRWDLPPADNSAMDGFAFACRGQRPGDRMTVAGFLPAGATFGDELAPGQALRIMTGAPLPPGCDSVVPVEDVEETDNGFRFRSVPQHGQHVRRRAEELRRDEPILAAGTPLHSGELGLLAAAGIERLRIYRPPRVALLSTGDELVELGQEPDRGRIVNSNFHLLRARLREEGIEVLRLGIARDTREDLAERIGRGLREADMLITTGGVSVGDRDLVQETLADFDFELGFWRVRIKPGKPVLFGTAQGKPVFGLPGNPAASAATFELFARPALRKMSGFPDPLPPRLRVRLSETIEGGSKRQRFLWGQLEERHGTYSFTPAARQGSGQNRSIRGSQALLSVPAGSDGLASGSRVEVMLLRLPPGLA